MSKCDNKKSGKGVICFGSQAADNGRKLGQVLSDQFLRRSRANLNVMSILVIVTPGVSLYWVTLLIFDL